MMNTYRKIGACVCCGALSLSLLAGCGAQNDSSSEQEISTSESTAEESISSGAEEQTSNESSLEECGYVVSSGEDGVGVVVSTLPNSTVYVSNASKYLNYEDWWSIVSVADSDGNATIKGIPAGDYSVFSYTNQGDESTYAYANVTLDEDTPLTKASLLSGSSAYTNASEIMLWLYGMGYDEQGNVVSLTEVDGFEYLQNETDLPSVSLGSSSTAPNGSASAILQGLSNASVAVYPCEALHGIGAMASGDAGLFDESGSFEATGLAPGWHAVVASDLSGNNIGTQVFNIAREDESITVDVPCDDVDVDSSISLGEGVTIVE